MTIDNNDSARRVQAILDVLGQSFLEATDEEIDGDLKAIGADPLKVDEQMKFSIEGAIDTFYQRKWEVLRQQRLQRINGYAKCVATVPTSPEQCRLLLIEVLGAGSNLRSLITAQFREVEDVERLSDADVTGIIRDLAALGFIRVNRANSE